MASDGLIEACDGCRYALIGPRSSLGSITVLCRRHPPQDKDAKHRYPRVDEHDWCGEWEKT